MKSRGTITAARILAFAAMFVAVFGVHAVHLLVHPSGHQSTCHQNDSEADNHAEAGVSHHHRGGTALSGSCPVCDFFKTRPVQSCSEVVDHHEACILPSTPIVRTDTPILRRHPLPRLSRAPPASFPTHIV